MAAGSKEQEVFLQAGPSLVWDSCGDWVFDRNWTEYKQKWPESFAQHHRHGWLCFSPLGHIIQDGKCIFCEWEYKKENQK